MKTLNMLILLSIIYFLYNARAPDDNRILIDGGKNLNAYSFIKWKYRLDKHYKGFDAIILTHGDEDHSLGLLPILDDPKIYVRRVSNNGIFKRSSGSKLGPTEKKDGKNMLNARAHAHTRTPSKNMWSLLLMIDEHEIARA